MNKLSIAERSKIIACLVEGNSIRSTCRITGTAKGTVLKLLSQVGEVCANYQDKAFRNLKCQRIQCDEIWSFVYSKAKNTKPENKGQAGDIWTWTALCADTKLVPCWFIGNRDAASANHFMLDLAGRLSNRVQLTTDGYGAYLNAVEHTFGNEIDYAMLVKIYGNDVSEEKRYSPAQCVGARKAVINGSPDFKHVSTSFTERQNLTMRMNMRRFTRLTNAFSKKVENHAHAIALHFMYYNFCRIHQTLRVTPAMEAGVSDHAWTIEELVNLLDSK